ncbi:MULTISPECIES: RusA family crossover junction endodeoxyribonuclease [unclassified Gilliamella]|uniref:RusA family crossover junction endodeoxyribonuclease n=1 Tax=unclassified Gilliamella TaxID=2685620 RepID=UPI0022698B34|nr:MULTISPECIES: RusA family crossover junction endodeoxyribonuclease [unclassified Gilliamella]MCX8602654.1 RusA family crossover junction endodeoxyribonuclease [Gilliamella sp. B3722]MCX8611885.1 RusA family crossover junction endodeoxyribonuclease [Gilliamella sp. B3891]MCX8614333.1 RusA family crossover junction endodeoxyribonuclease [Gilliamella sp. B3773]MCX8621608.1 RusA family crossover junction endodeoxyribonuclease [Gilliamella sp. B3892]MCX8624030.1 RusA family crossover junction en
MIHLILPYPPTVNHYWGTVGKRRYIKADGIEFRNAVIAIVLQNKANKKLADRVMVNIKAYMPDRRKRDLDNINKAIFDALIHSNVILDDEQIDVLHSERKEVVKGGRIELFISKLGV